MDIFTLEPELVSRVLFDLYFHCYSNPNRRWDLWWPPVWGGSYWTASLQYRALLSGARLGRYIGRGESVSEYESHAKMIFDYLQESRGVMFLDSRRPI